MDRRYAQIIDVAVNRDNRGSHTKFFGATPERIAVEDYSISEVFMTTGVKDAVRGLHIQVPGQPKLIQVISGAVIGNILCCDPTLPEFGKAIHFELTAESEKKIYVPGSWAPGYRALEDNTRVLYFAGADFVAGGDIGIDPFDPALDLNWGEDFTKSDAILSPRDETLPPFQDFVKSLENAKKVSE